LISLNNTPAHKFDPRIHPVRPDLAASRYQGRYQAAAYAKGILYSVTQACLPLRGRPDKAASQTSQLIYGEKFEVFEIRDGWAWGQALRDDYVGFADISGLASPATEPNHYLTALASHIYPEADLKSFPTGPLYMTAELAVKPESAVNGFVELAGGGWVYARHLAPTPTIEPDYVATALNFSGVPYLWGGKTAAGLDCSALVQLALFCAGTKIPRDTDLQRQALGPALPLDAPLLRGDIAFFPGHVGIMLDATRLLHANAAHMAVSIDPLDEVIAIVAKNSATPYLGARRLNP
jgi:cell wall-associated NlpC family hydrolase